MNRKSLTLSVAFGLCYLWSGGIFMTVFFKLYDHFDQTSLTYISDVLYYIMQAAGVVLFSLLLRNKTINYRRQGLHISLIIISLAFGSLAMITDDPIRILVSGAIMNIAIGCLLCTYLIRISKDLDTSCRGKCFALSYAIGSIGTYLLSVPFDGNALNSGYIIFIYILLAALAAFLVVLFDRQCDSEDIPAVSGNIPDASQAKCDGSIVLLTLIPLFFMIINSLGYHFEQKIADDVNILFTRAFYSVGLIAAGIITDKKRSLGAISAFLSLSFPLVCLSFAGGHNINVISSIMSYVFLGFINVYSVILFLDIGDFFPDTDSISVLGFGISRIGTAIGTSAGIMLEHNQTLLICITLTLYAVCGLIFFSHLQFYHNNAKSVVTETSDERKERLFKEYISIYGFNGKQTEVLRLILLGYPNGEIAETLFLAESTVKYHVKNILKITGFKNRNELISDYASHESK